MKHAYTPPWIFGVTNLPFGVAGTYSGVAMPFLLREAGVSVEKIAALAAIVFLPAAYQLFWAPILDLGIRRRTWLVLCATSGSLCLGATLVLRLPEQLVAYEILMVAGQTLVGFGCLTYSFIAGVAFAAFSAVVYEIVGTAGRTASTLYSVFPAAGNQAIAYMLLLDGGGHRLWGTRGLWLTDAALNLAGVVLLVLLLGVVFPDRSLNEVAANENKKDDTGELEVDRTT